MLLYLLFPVDTDIDESSLSEDILPEDAMSPDSNHNLQVTCHKTVETAMTIKRSRNRNDFIEDDQHQAMIEATESIRVINGSRNADDSFDEQSQDEQRSSLKYYLVDTPSSDLVIDERSIGSQTVDLLDSPDQSESCQRTTEDSNNSNKGRCTYVYIRKRCFYYYLFCYLAVTYNRYSVSNCLLDCECIQ